LQLKALSFSVGVWSLRVEFNGLDEILTKAPNFGPARILNASMEALSFQLKSWRLPASALWMPGKRLDPYAE